ncbi:hybrid sensor histidine kinase/response regulator [Halovivax cerinus]|uniref:histidine kinase n=1 Tax=Halovivax cerinus TaxID=1487865 RepID=A0ABD5NLQ9_9EURY|nr:PAS domain S-box protein [Halovivax cerinus]
MSTVDPQDDSSTWTVVYLHPDPAVGGAVADGLRTDAIDVVPANRVGDARSLIENRAVDCLVTAYDLPTTDGISLLRSLRADGFVTPVIFHAERGDESIAAEAIEVGISGYVPIDDVATESLDSLSKTLSNALTETQSTAALKRRWQTVESLHEVALEFETCATPAETYEFAVEALTKVLDVYAAALYVKDGTALVPEATVGSLPGGWGPYGLDEGVAGQTFQRGESSRTDHIPSDDAAAPADATLRSGISVPVGDFGVLQAVSTSPGAYSEHDQKLAELLAAHVSAAISRIRSKRAMRAERDRFATLFENVPDAVAITRGEERYVADVNPAFEETFGFDRDEIVDEPIDGFLVPEASEAIRVADTVGTDEVVRDHLTRRGRTGTREFSFTGFAIEDAETYREYGIYTDVTDRNRRERELRRYKRLVEAVGDPMYVLDPDGRVEMVNQAMAAVLGTTPEDVEGCRPESFMPAEHVDRGAELLRELLSDPDRQWDTFEMDVDPDDGDAFVAETMVSPLFDDGAFSGSVGVIRDITRRRERERRIRDLHEGTRELMSAEGVTAVAEVATEVATDALDFSLNGVFLYDEPADALVPVANTDRAQRVLGDPPVVEPGDGLMWEAYETGEPASYGDVRAASDVMNPETIVRSEAYVPLGDHGVIILSSPAVDDFDDEALALAKILGSNVEAALDRAEREATLARRTSELERQNERLDEFAGVVSHDLRNPLTLAEGHLELASEGAPAEIEPHVDEVDWALGRMGELIEDMLSLARNGRPLEETADVDLVSVVDAAHRTVDPDLAVAVDDTLGTIEASERRLRALFENCLRNAIEHVGPDVSLSIRRTDDGFAIDDDGPGIPPADRDAVLETGYTTSTDGTGYGLAIVADVAETHGWTVEIEESPDGGARIHVVTDGTRAGPESDGRRMAEDDH